MDFKLDIGELTNTIRDYENTIKTLAEQKENINKTVKELTDLGWSGAAKDQFEQNHSKKQEFYTKLEEDVKYVENAMERDEKPRAIQLKKRCEGFVDCIKRSAGGAALTHDDVGTISLQYSGQALINNNVDECINDHYKKMDSKFEEIQNLVNSLTFTSFSIGEDIEKARKSLKDQTTSLTDFNDSFNEYCSGVKAMESNICSVFGKISGITEGMSKFRGISVISEGGQIDKNKVISIMLKNPKSLSNEEKEILSYVEKVLGEEKYAELKLQAVREGQNSAQLTNSSSVAYIVDPKTGEIYDISNIDNETLNRISYLADKVKWFNTYQNGQSDDKDSWMFWKLYSKDHFEQELATILSDIKSGKYAERQEIKARVYMGFDGTLEAIGGGTEFLLGGNIAFGASALTEGLAAPIAIPMGTSLMADGGSCVVEGGTKIYNAISSSKIKTLNPLRDLAFKKAFGDDEKGGKGGKYYDRFALVCAGVCITSDVATLSKAIKPDTIKVIPRPQNIAKAEQLNLPTEIITTKTATKTTTKTVDTLQVIDKSTKTPMILQRTITEHPLLNGWDFTKNYGKDVFYTGVDIRNTKGTAQSVESGLVLDRN